MSKFKDFIKKQTKKTKIILGVGLLVVILGIALFLKFSVKKPDPDFIVGELKLASELTTAEISFKGWHDYKDDGVAILNKSNFLMTYSATARLGIDIKEVKVSVNNLTKKVFIKIPKAELLEVKVDPKSIKYRDEKFSLFNFNSKEDANKAQSEVESKAFEYVNSLGILDMVDKQAETLIRGLVEPLVPDEYEIVVEVLEETK